MLAYGQGSLKGKSMNVYAFISVLIYEFGNYKVEEFLINWSIGGVFFVNLCVYFYRNYIKK